MYKKQNTPCRAPGPVSLGYEPPKYNIGLCVPGFEPARHVQHRGTKSEKTNRNSASTLAKLVGMKWMNMSESKKQYKYNTPVR